jgi:hypothetical protein
MSPARKYAVAAAVLVVLGALFAVCISTHLFVIPD